jgi:hypothetical protein
MHAPAGLADEWLNLISPCVRSVCITSLRTDCHLNHYTRSRWPAPERQLVTATADLRHAQFLLSPISMRLSLMPSPSTSKVHVNKLTITPMAGKGYFAGSMNRPPSPRSWC